MTSKPVPPPLLNADDLIGMARRAASTAGDAPVCSRCHALVCPGWESLPASFDATRLLRVGTLRQPGDDEPTLREHHPDGTHGWSALAPIAPAWFPYNRCEVWRCAACTRHFLRYTEYGGYYVDERIRELDAARVVDVPFMA